MTKEWQEAMNERAKEQKMNPISGEFVLPLCHNDEQLILPKPNPRYCVGGLRGQGLRSKQVDQVDQYFTYQLLLCRTSNERRGFHSLLRAVHPKTNNNRLHVRKYAFRRCQDVHGSGPSNFKILSRIILVFVNPARVRPHSML